MPLANVFLLLFLFACVVSQGMRYLPTSSVDLLNSCDQFFCLSDLPIRQNYEKETEDGVNKQIGEEMKAFYTYRDMVRMRR